jgi:uncharacterized protein (TIGR03437 family)
MPSSSRFYRIIPLIVVLVFFVGLFVSIELSKHRQDESDFEIESEAGEKPGFDEWFYEQRAYPLRTIPAGARMRAIDQMERAEERRRARAFHKGYGIAADAIAPNQPKWEALGPRPIANGNTGPLSRPAAGRATAIALDPRYDGVNNQTVYVGAAQGGLWRSRDNGANWEPLIDDQASLAIGSLAVDPVDPNVIYVGTGEGNSSGDSYYGAGLLKSIDGGATWRLIVGPVSTVAPRSPSFQTTAIMSIAIDPTNTQTIYLCTRPASSSGPSGGNGAANVAPGQRGVWKSTDGGETWRNLNVIGNGGISSANDVLIHTQSPNIIFAGMPGQGIYRSLASGEPGTWEKLTQGLPVDNIGRIKLAVGPPTTPSFFPTFYAAIATSTSQLHGVYVSTDNGNTWTRTVGQPASIGQTNYNLTLSVDPLNPNIIYLGMVTFYRSVDGGNTWVSQLNGNNNGQGGIHVDQHFSMVFNAKPNIFFIANDGGIWRSDNANDPGQAMGWVNLNQTLNTVQFQSVAVHPTSPNYLIGGTQDNGTNRFTGNAAWTRVAGGDGGFALVDQNNPSTVWHSFQNSSGSATSAPSYGPRVSFNAGDSWTDRGCRTGCQAVPGSFNPTDRVGFYAPMTLNTGFTQPANVIYWGTQRLYRSADIGQTWTGLGPSTDGFGLDLSKGSGRLSAITAHPKLDNSTNPAGEIVWIGTSDGNVQVTANAGALAGATFTNVTKAPLPNRFVSDIALDPNDTKRAYVVYSGFNVNTAATPGHVFVTTDMGETWSNISGDLPDVPVTSIAIDPLQVGILYIGTDIGVFQTTDGGGTWIRLGNGMPRVASYMVRYQAATRSLVVATHGRGMFRLKLLQPETTVSAASFERSALAVEGIVSAFGSDLADRTETAGTIPLPTRLGGASVRIADSTGLERLAPLFAVSKQQINYQIPPDISPGPITVTIAKEDNATAFGIERVSSVAPSIFTANANGIGVAAGVAVLVRNGTQTFLPIARFDNTLNPPQFVPEPIDLGNPNDQVVLVLFATGARRRSDLSAAKASIGGLELQPAFLGPAPGFVGLDQCNIPLSRTLAGRNVVDVTLRADGVGSNIVKVAIK